MQDQIHQLLREKRLIKNWKQSTTLNKIEDSENHENQELKREIEKMRAVIEVQAKKINPKTKITNSEYF